MQKRRLIFPVLLVLTTTAPTAAATCRVTYDAYGDLAAYHGDGHVHAATASR